jgi:hypothetical protein
MTQKLIARKWTHAHEEDEAAGAQVFRPSEGKFPLSRGRQKIDLTPLSSKRTTIGADDVYKDTSGQWSLSDDGKVLTFVPDDGSDKAVAYEVISLTAERLVLRRKAQ